MTIHCSLRSSMALGLVSLSALLCGCSGVADDQAASPATDDPGVTGTVEQEIIGGFAANSAKYNAIGAIGTYYEYNGYIYGFSPYCSASLIGPQTVLTAKHCIREPPYWENEHIGFAMGPDARNPQRVVEIVESLRAPGDSGGFVSYGHDVGVVHLAQKVTDITPLSVKPLTDSQIGKDFVAIGYGNQDAHGYKQGTRRMGKVELRAREGRTFEVLFGSFAAFYRWQTGQDLPTDCELPVVDSGREDKEVPTVVDAGVVPGHDSAVPATDARPPWDAPPAWDAPPPCDPWRLQSLRNMYETTVLDPGYEVVVGGTPGDSQPSWGDSGGPLIKADAQGQLVAYGVVSGGVAGNGQAEGAGAVYAAFGPDVMQFLKDAKRWVDPCKGLSYTGVCDENVARRCTRSTEGYRHIVEVDCGLVDMLCGMQTDGVVGCGEDLPPPPDGGPRDSGYDHYDMYDAGTKGPDYRAIVDEIFLRRPGE